MRLAKQMLLASMFLVCLGSSAQNAPRSLQPLDRRRLAQTYFGEDAPWYVDRIPFLEIDDSEIQQIYYYRWKVFRSHIREIGAQGTTVMEFLGDVPWAREPYTDLNDSASFHLREGRWLRDPSFVDDLIDHEYTGGGNDRHFSESIAAATVDTTLVTGDPGPALRHLDTMQHIYNLWDDHLDRTRNLYWIEPLLDATEYTISSIDASGAGFEPTAAPEDFRNGFTGGYAFRPSINTYQYANAMAIAHLAAFAGDVKTAANYKQRADNIRSAVLAQLWNPDLKHFTDRYQRSTKYVTAGDFVRGRELVGYTPWLYDLPPKENASVSYSDAWQHIFSASQLAGPQGLRTVEPSYPRYLVQYRYDKSTGLRECQWNGPSWPFQTSQTLTALANLLNDYPPYGFTSSDYLHLLRQYTHQHFLSPGHPDLQEDYNPDTGGPIVGLPRSHHYEHSTYVDLILGGLIGIRPRADDILGINPLMLVAPGASAPPIRWFRLENLKYHGHDLAIAYDLDGSRYHLGLGLFVYVDGKLVKGPVPLGRVEVPLQPASADQLRPKPRRVDLAVNVGFVNGPAAAASSSAPGSPASEAIDGRLWFFPEIANGWSPKPTDGPSSWFAIDFRQPLTLGSIELYFFSDGQSFKVPGAIHLQYESASGWQDVAVNAGQPVRPVANGETKLVFLPLTTNKLRVVIANPAAPARARLVEIEAFAPVANGERP